MSDVGGADAMEHVPQSASTDGMTAGAMMRSAREAAGLHVAALAVSMKIPVKKLEALEADRLDLLHDAVFVRALAASVCRALKIDPAPILNKLPLNGAPKLNTDERGINAPFHSPSDAAGMSLGHGGQARGRVAFGAHQRVGQVVGGQREPAEAFGRLLRHPRWRVALAPETRGGF